VLSRHVPSLPVLSLSVGSRLPGGLRLLPFLAGLPRVGLPPVPRRGPAESGVLTLSFSKRCTRPINIGVRTCGGWAGLSAPAGTRGSCLEHLSPGKLRNALATSASLLGLAAGSTQAMASTIRANLSTESTKPSRAFFE